MRLAAIALALALAGCANGPSAPPVISDFNGDSVKLNVACGGGNACLHPRPEDDAEANRICGSRGRKAQYASSRTANEVDPVLGIVMYHYEHLYLCV